MAMSLPHITALWSWQNHAACFVRKHCTCW